MIERLRDSQEHEDNQLRGIMEQGMIPITWDLWTYANLAQSMEQGETYILGMNYFILEGLNEVADRKPHYKELLSVLIDRYPILETYRQLVEEVR